jgi:hypothetical protein
MRWTVSVSPCAPKWLVVAPACLKMAFPPRHGLYVKALLQRAVLYAFFTIESERNETQLNALGKLWRVKGY